MQRIASDLTRRAIVLRLRAEKLSVGNRAPEIEKATGKNRSPFLVVAFVLCVCCVPSLWAKDYFLAAAFLAAAFLGAAAFGAALAAAFGAALAAAFGAALGAALGAAAAAAFFFATVHPP